MSTFGFKYFLSVLALVFIIEGTPYFLSPAAVKKWFLLVQQMNDAAIRMIGISFMFIGLFLLYIALRIL